MVEPLQIATVSAYLTINSERQLDDRTYAPIANRKHDRNRRAIALIRVTCIGRLQKYIHTFLSVTTSWQVHRG